MRLRRGVSMIVLAVLAGSPVAGAVCAIRCEAGATAASAAPARRVAPASVQHASAAPSSKASTAEACHSSTRSGLARIGSSSGHACGDHDRTFGDAPASLTASRHDMGVMLTATAMVPTVHGFLPQQVFRASLAHGPPVAPAAPIRTALVLRI